MNSIVYVNSDIRQSYNEYSFFSRIRDRFKISLQGESLIKDLGVQIIQVKLPPNFNERAYLKNLAVAKKMSRVSNSLLAPKTYRILDYGLYNEAQRRLFSFSVVQSVKMVLRMVHRSIKNSCIVIYEPGSHIIDNIAFELAKEAKYIVLLSEKLQKAHRLSEQIIASYGVSPVITDDYNFALQEADFIISLKGLQGIGKKPVWYLDNVLEPQDSGMLAVNDVAFFTPWNIASESMSMELLGAILGLMGEKDLEEAMKRNGIYIEAIKFKERDILPQISSYKEIVKY